MLCGADGLDLLRGEVGDDTMVRRDGNDTFGVDNTADVVVELAGGGIDTLDTILSGYTLGDQFEQLEFSRRRSRR